MSPEEHEAAVVNMGEYNKSTEFIFSLAVFDEDGAYDPSFDLLDNDYIEILTCSWDTAKNRESGKPWLYLTEGLKIGPCGN